MNYRLSHRKARKFNSELSSLASLMTELHEMNLNDCDHGCEKLYLLKFIGTYKLKRNLKMQTFDKKLSYGAFSVDGATMKKSWMRRVSLFIIRGRFFM